MRQSDKVLLTAIYVFDALLAIFDFAYGGVMLESGEYAPAVMCVVAGLAASVCVAFGCLDLITNYLEGKNEPTGI